MSRRHGRAVAPNRPRRTLTTVAATVTALLTLSSCGLLSGSNAADSGGNGAVEKSTIKLGALPALEQAVVAVAQDKGYFRQEGLNVDVQPVSSGPTGLQSLIGGDLDMSLGSYTPLVQAEAKVPGQIKIVNELLVSGPNLQALMTVPNSKLQKSSDAPGKTIAITSKGAITDIATKAALQDQGVDDSKTNFVEMGLSDMAGALQRGDVDGAVMVEPFVTQASQQLGARAVLDSFSGGTSDFPVAGTATTTKFAQENPKTVAAFQRAIAKAQQDAQNRDVVSPLLPKFAKVSPQVAPLVQLGNFPTSTEASRLQRVSTLMKRFNLIQQDVDVSKMIIPPPQA